MDEEAPPAQPHAEEPTAGGVPAQPSAAPPVSVKPPAEDAPPSAPPPPSLASSRLRTLALWEVAWAALAVLLYLLLADAAVETVRTSSPLQWIVLGTVAGYFIATAAFWRSLSWFARTAASILMFLALAAATAWLPGGLTHGLALAGLPTSTVFEAVTAGGILLAAGLVARWSFVPVPERTVLGLLVLYGLTATALGIRTNAAYPDLFHGHSEWQRLPPSLQGVALGTSFMAATFLVYLFYGLAKIRGTQLKAWGVEIAALGLAVALAAAAWVESPFSIGAFVAGPGPGPAPSPITPGPSPAPPPAPAPAPTPAPTPPGPGPAPAPPTPAPTPTPGPAGPSPSPAPAPVTPGPAPTPAPSPVTPAPGPAPAPSPVPLGPSPFASGRVVRAAAYAGTLYFTRFQPGTCPNVNKVAFTYTTDSEFALEKPQQVACVPNADGIIFAPDGDLLVGGGNVIYKVKPQTGTFSSVKSGQWALHLMLDPNLQQLWASSIPGTPTAIPLNPFADGTPHALVGDDGSVTTIVWDAAGHAFYTASGAGGNGNFGTIDFAEFKTTRLLSNVPAAHGMVFDPFTRHLILMGSTHLTQIDPGPPVTIVSDVVIDHVDQGNMRYGVQFDQGTVDGQGHLYAASNNGHLAFIDYSATGKIGDSKNFKSVQFLQDKLDDIAPIVGPGAARVRPQPRKYQVIEESGRIRIVLPPEVLFDFDRFDLKASADAALTDVKRSIIDKFPGAHLIVEGHTDDRGTQQYNMQLGANRAQSVAAWLRGHGISPALVDTKSYGKTRPRYVPETTDENRTRNRRVEIIVVK